MYLKVNIPIEMLENQEYNKKADFLNFEVLLSNEKKISYLKSLIILIGFIGTKKKFESMQKMHISVV